MQKERERGIRKTETEEDWRERKRDGKKERRERHGGRPVGDPIPQRGKVVAYTQATQPRMQPSTRTHIKTMQAKKPEKKKKKNHTSALR